MSRERTARGESGRALVRRAGVALAAAVLLCVGLASPVSADTSAALLSSVTVTGHGYGPGVGLSQWGAEERAKAGQRHDQILAFYYPGAVIGTAPSTTVRVLLDEQPRLIVGSGSAFTLVDAAGTTRQLPAGHYGVTADGVEGARLAFPVRLLPGRKPAMLGGNRYRGTLRLDLDGAKVRVVNSLPLEQYVADVVSVENPAYWPQEALRSQAIASRTYALANLHPGASFDLYSDNRSQNYVGLRKEYPSSVAAAAATKGRVLRYGGELIQAFFTAANGGMTSNVDGVWGGQPLPYLAARPDPFDARSPQSNWGPIHLSMPTLRQALPQVPSSIVRIAVATNDGRRLSAITLVGSDGSTRTVDGTTFQQRLGLRSTYLSVTPGYD